MAVANQNGRFIGKLGNTVSYMLKGKYVMRTIGKYTKKRSPKQLANQMSMKVTNRFLVAVKPFISLGYKLEATGTDKSAFNLATSSVKTQAIAGEYPNLRVDYSKVMVSKGTVPAPQETRIEKTDSGVLIQWNADHAGSNLRREDSVMLLLYFPVTNSSMISFHAAKRKEGSCLFELPESQLNAPIEAYISFKQSDGNAVSDSVYAGNLNGEAQNARDLEDKKHYAETKHRFDLIEAALKKKRNLQNDRMVNDKAYRNLLKEYEVLKERLKNLPGKALS